ncbi:Phosphofructokinase [Nakaseomyces glabratus]|nr:Phosphofructokinase [Nakaseomyces glabratus]KAH7599440.1 Phosphofructokinase [Nakaseomyces glabratus]KAH7612853.1 Phosphofructokinase [Nakaseomyces glabratus]
MAARPATAMVKNSMVHGVTRVDLTAYSAESFENAIQFYLAFLVLDELDQNEDGGVVLANSHVYIKISYKEDGEMERKVNDRLMNLIEKTTSGDWRAVSSNVLVYTVDDIGLVKETLKRIGLPHQAYPTELTPAQIYTLDPLGNVVGFTGNKLAIATEIPFVLPTEEDDESELSSKESSYTNLTSLMRTTSGYPSLPFGHSRTHRNIAILTSGGDAPGMNSVIRAVVRTALFKGCRVYIVREGLEGLVKGYIEEFFWEDVGGWNSQGGTNIGTAKSNAFLQRRGRLLAARNLIIHDIDSLIVCGGDGSLAAADIFKHEWHSLISELLSSHLIKIEQLHSHKHLTICGISASIDNDIPVTDASIGAYSALDRICKALDYIQVTAESTSRAYVVEIMGGNCGWLTLLAGIATAADYIFLPECPQQKEDWRTHLQRIVKRNRRNGRRNTLVLLCEGAVAADSTPITSRDVHQVLSEELDIDTRITVLGHVQRGGAPVAYDRILATLQGVEAVSVILESTPDTPSYLIAVKENKILRKDLQDAVRQTFKISTSLKDREFEKAFRAKEAEFIEHYHNFLAINAADQDKKLVKSASLLNIAIINIGAPAGGMNSAVYAMASYCMWKGHRPIAIYNGWSGLARHESIRSLKWSEIVGWQSRGGSEIGTNRETPNEADVGMIAYYFQKYKIDGLIIVGGFEGFESLRQLEKARELFPAFRIPMVLIPATLSNNVPGTEYSLGSDTALNSLTEFCDNIGISSAATKDKAYVVEVQGGNSGYLATLTSIAIGACATYVPEEGISLVQLSEDIETISKSFDCVQTGDHAGKIILKSQNASKAMSAEKLANIITEEAAGKFEAKSVIPGHLQQGGTPSPIDRTRATKFAIRAVDFILEKSKVLKSQDDVIYEHTKELTESAVVLGVKGSNILFTSVKQLYLFETNVRDRMPKVIHWDGIRTLSDHMAGRRRIYEDEDN